MPANVTIDKTDLFELNLTLGTIKGGASLAIMRATNDAIGGIKTKAVDEIYNKVALTKVNIRTAYKVNKMYVKDTSADITCKGKPIPLINFQARSVNKGVTLKVLRASKRSTVRHAFIAKMKSTHRGVFWRADRPRGRGAWLVGKKMALPSPRKGGPLRPYQLPVHELYGPRIPDIFDDPEILEKVFKEASTRFDDRLAHHTSRLLESAR